LDHLPQKDVTKDMKKLYFKNAFTMIELVFVIVVLGILAAIAMPRVDQDRTQEAADSILADIRYTQHMAMVDFRQRAIDTATLTATDWQRSFWQIKIESCGNGTGLFVTVGADKDYGGDISTAEAAIDPSNGKPMLWSNAADCGPGDDVSSASENIFITKKFGVTAIDSTNCNNVQYIGFDHLGRPHLGFSGSTSPDYSTYMSSTCTFTFTVDSGNFSISILPETGYAQIVGQDAS